MNDNKVFLVFDWPVKEPHPLHTKLNQFLNNRIILKGCKQIIPNSTVKKIRFMIHYSGFCSRLISISNGSDVIVHRLDLLAIINWWISYLSFRPRKIVCCNIMLKKSSGIKWKLLRYLYRKPILDNNFVATVTSKYYGKQLKRNLGVSVDFPVLHDDYGNISGLERNFEDKGLTVFGGGNNGRDWDMYMKVAKRLPDVKFFVAMPEAAYEKYKNNKPSNVSLFTKLPGKEFFELQSNCSITFLPLTSQAPSGLIVLFSSALMERPVVISDTICTQEYVDNGTTGIMNRTEEEFAESIHTLLNNIEKRKELAIKQKIKVKELGSPESYVRDLSKIINSFS